MENKIEDGGPAFPIGNNPGMSLRDYFAAAALLSPLANSVGDAFRIADTMLHARKIDLWLKIEKEK